MKPSDVLNWSWIIGMLVLLTHHSTTAAATSVTSSPSPSPPFIITQPNSLTNWVISKTYNITWSTLPSMGVEYVHVTLYRASKPSDSHQLLYYQPNIGLCSVFLEPSVMSDINETYYDWVVTVEDAQDSTVNATSQMFSITYPAIQIQLSAPRWIVDEDPNIAWSTTLGSILIDSVFIQLVQQNFEFNLTVDYPNSGYFTWQGVSFGWISQAPYHIKICWTRFPSVCGVSSSLMISAPIFNITIPSSNLVTGGMLPVRWVTSDVVTSASVSLIVPGSGNFLLCANSTTDRCDYYPLPYWLYGLSNYNVTVCWDKYPSICGQSSDLVIEAAIDLSKSGLEPLVVGDGGIYNISWETNEVPVSQYELLLCKRYSPFTDGIEVVSIAQGNMRQQFAWSYIWNTSNVNIGAFETGVVYFLKLEVNLQGNVMYGASRIFSIISQQTLRNIVVESNPTRINLREKHTISFGTNATNSTHSNTTLPYVDIYLYSIDGNASILIGSHISLSRAKYEWNPSKHQWTQLHFYSKCVWKVCFSSGLSELKCGYSTKFSVNSNFVIQSLVTPRNIIYASIALTTILSLSIGICIVRKRCRRRGFERIRDLEVPPVISHAPPSSFASSHSQRVPVPSAPSADNLCKICFDRPLNMIIRPCNHAVMCAECSTNIVRCPMCSGDIEAIERFFM